MAQHTLPPRSDTAARTAPRTRRPCPSPGGDRGGARGSQAGARGYGFPGSGWRRSGGPAGLGLGPGSGPLRSVPAAAARGRRRPAEPPGLGQLPGPARFLPPGPGSAAGGVPVPAPSPCRGCLGAGAAPGPVCGAEHEGVVLVSSGLGHRNLQLIKFYAACYFSYEITFKNQSCLNDLKKKKSKIMWLQLLLSLPLLTSIYL